MRISRIAAVCTEESKRTRSCWGPNLCKLSIILWTGFTCVRMLSGHSVWIWAISDSAPTHLLLAVPLVLAVVALLLPDVHKMWMSPLAVSLLIYLPQSDVGAQFFPKTKCRPAQETRVDGKPISILTWNTQFWAEKHPQASVAAQLVSKRPDIVALQEIQLTVRKVILPQTPEDYPAGLYKTMIRKGELLIATDLPVLQDNHALKSTPHLWADVKVPSGKTLRIITTHIPLHLSLSYSPGDGYFFDFIQSRFHTRNTEFLGLRDMIRNSPHPVAVMGDFNSTASMAPFRSALQDLCDSVAAAGITNTATWSVMGLPLWRPDYLFVSPSVRILDHKVRAMGDISDHRAVQVLVDL